MKMRNYSIPAVIYKLFIIELSFTFHRNHPVILGENNCNLPKIFTIIAEAFQHEALSTTSEIGIRMLNIVRQVMVCGFSCFDCGTLLNWFPLNILTFYFNVCMHSV